MAVCIAVIGKENSPKYINCTEPEHELDYHFKVHTSLDVIEEKLEKITNALKTKSAADQYELYLGLLYSTEEHKIFGYATNTKIKFVIVVDATHPSLRDNEIKTMFRRLHTAYTDVVSNPFYIPGENIESKRQFANSTVILAIQLNRDNPTIWDRRDVLPKKI